MANLLLLLLLLLLPTVLHTEQPLGYSSLLLLFEAHISRLLLPSYGAVHVLKVIDVETSRLGCKQARVD
jgi:hypothetical protein